MYCSNCGAPASGNFCSRCGAPLTGASGTGGPSPLQDWTQEIRGSELLKRPEVRQQISMAENRAKKRMSGEKFLSVAEKLMPVGVPLGAIGTAASSLYTRLGIKTGKSDARQFAQPAGRVLLGVLCALASGGHALRRIEQAEDGCIIEASLPSDIWSFEGDLFVTVRRQQPQETYVEARTNVPGQLFDWGKSKRALSKLFDEIGYYAAQSV